MHRKIKIALDIAMLLLFIIELAGMFVPSRVHMVLGALLLVAVIAHNIVNRKFYQTLLQGPYTPRRIGNGLTSSCCCSALWCWPFPAWPWGFRHCPVPGEM